MLREYKKTVDYYNQTEKEILRLYDRLNLGECSLCRQCREGRNLSGPIGCWLVGEKFNEEDKRILFIGKNARDNPGNKYHTYQNTFEDTRMRLWNKGYPYWRYTKEITERIFGDNSCEHIAFTNIVKCNDSSGRDTTSDDVKKICILDLQVLRKEIEIIQPTNIVFYTALTYDSFIPQVFDSFEKRQYGERIIGAKSVPWLCADAVIGGDRINVLRTGHPERKKREDFVNAVCEWLNTASQ